MEKMGSILQDTGMSPKVVSSRRVQLLLLLFVEFIDYLGMGLALPYFAAVIFNPNGGFLPFETSAALRGSLLALLIAAAPLLQLFSAPLLGTLSDLKGRKIVLQGSLLVGILAYLAACYGVWQESVFALFFYRFLFGISSGSAAVVQASVSERSSDKEKTKNFGLLNMALGAGFCLGPFIGGVLSDCDLFPCVRNFLPFLFVAFLTGVNLLLIRSKFVESWVPKAGVRPSFHLGWKRALRIWEFKELRLLFIAMFLFFFGWNFFIQFIPVVLIEQFQFNLAQTGYFYAYTGLLFAVSSGFLIRPIANRFPPLLILRVALLLAGVYLFFFLFLPSERFLWFYTPLFTFFLALVYPAATATIASRASPETQGEVLGIYSSLQALSLVLGPLITGGFIGIYPQLPILIGSLVMICAGILLSTQKRVPR